MGYFFDPATGGPARLELLSVDGHDFHVLQQLAYRSDDHDADFVFPADLDRFHTDMASVPSVFTWLVPRSGVFLPAAVMHDALTGYGPESDAGSPAGDYLGPPVDRVEADRLFRVAMGDIGTGRVRRWLMWAAVTMATLWVWPRHRWLARVVVVATLVVISGLGLVATADLFDLWDVLPWMGERPWWQELVTGAIAAAVIPGVIALAWGRRWLAGAITGWSLAFLLHITLAIAVVYGLYLLLERIISGPKDDRGVHLSLRAPQR